VELRRERSFVKPYLLISRALLHYVSLDIARIPERQAESALRLQLIGVSPYARFGFAWERLGGSASVYFWDAARIESMLGEAGLESNDVLMIPEPFLRQAAPEGVSLQQCAEGFEAVYSRSGLRLSTRWWPNRPNEFDWRDFLRDAGLVENVAAEPLEMPWLKKPSPNVHLPKAGFKAGASEAGLYKAAVIAYGAAVAVLAAEDVQLLRGTEKMQEKIEELRPKVEGALHFRDEAEKLQKRVLQLMANEDRARQVNLMAAITATGVGQRSGILLQEWEFREGKLKIVLLSPKGSINRVEYLNRLAGVPGLENVKLLSDGNPQTIIAEATVGATVPAFTAPPATTEGASIDSRGSQVGR